MRFLLAQFIVVIILGFTVTSSGQSIPAREKPEEPAGLSGPIYTPELIASFGLISDDELEAIIDKLQSRLTASPSASGYVILYNGWDTPPVNYNDPIYQQKIADQLRFRRIDPSRITMVRRGFRRETTTEIWFVPSLADPPVVTEEKVTLDHLDTQACLYEVEQIDLSIVPELGDGYLLPRVLELKRKKRSDTDLPVPEADAETDEPLTAESIERFKTHWVNVVFAKYLFKTPDEKGVVIFYADDQYYDVAKLRELVDEQMLRLVRDEKLDPRRLKVMFGGYRESIDVEYLLVPVGADDPPATPHFRVPAEAEVNK